jgi:hypothetical protein
LFAYFAYIAFGRIDEPRLNLGWEAFLVILDCYERFRGRELIDSVF